MPSICVCRALSNSPASLIWNSPLCCAKVSLRSIPLSAARKVRGAGLTNTPLRRARNSSVFRPPSTRCCKRFLNTELAQLQRQIRDLQNFWFSVIDLDKLRDLNGAIVAFTKYHDLEGLRNILIDMKNLRNAAALAAPQESRTMSSHRRRISCTGSSGRAMRSSSLPGRFHRSVVSASPRRHRHGSIRDYAEYAPRCVRAGVAGVTTGSSRIFEEKFPRKFLSHP